MPPPAEIRWLGPNPLPAMVIVPPAGASGGRNAGNYRVRDFKRPVGSAGNGIYGNNHLSGAGSGRNGGDNLGVRPGGCGGWNAVKCNGAVALAGLESAAGDGDLWCRRFLLPAERDETDGGGTKK